ncbi:SAM binding motif:Protein-L-isoaspartate [Tepidicaulis marinus]|uniref:Protein-L-isoaspartate O-methyltransferase n=1 Tax=Tepidicaulis marinus TaxID=1333998 RepID=A0A081B7J7_9HYPH|nr:protein-L-isoaspartate O-methyltransferase [Tepidicaulis marinus]GAK44015.1 SAM binding motif:Protein-L-isoaspartate [Tepidicaulis marinus]
MADYTDARLNMVDSQLRTSGVTDPRVLDVTQEVPREIFVPAALRPVAYLDGDLRVTGAGETPRFLMRPYSFGKLLELAIIREDDVVLDIGTATGYSAAVLAKLAETVVAVESDEELAGKATANLDTLGITNAAVVTGALEAGYAKGGPYDVIVLEGAVERLPADLLDQLKENGRLVTIFHENGRSRGRIYTKRRGTVTFRDAFDGSAELLPGFERSEGFVF